MSMNSLGVISQIHTIKMGRCGIPLKLMSYSIRYVHIQGDKQAHRALIPAKASAMITISFLRILLWCSYESCLSL
jgi:hypothetical protein